jgi:dimethylamine monooxygenase subunit A
VLSAFWPQALLAARLRRQPALHALAAHAAAEHPRPGPGTATAPRPGLGVRPTAAVRRPPGRRFGLGDEVARCLRGAAAGLAPRRPAGAGLRRRLRGRRRPRRQHPLAGRGLPSHWAPEDKVGRHFAEVHAPVADNALLLQAARAARLVTGPSAGSASSGRHRPPAPARPPAARRRRCAGQHDGGRPQAWFRTERQTFIPCPARAGRVHHPRRRAAAGEVLDTPERARALHEAIASMSPAVLAYRGLAAVREPLLAWLARGRASTPHEAGSRSAGAHHL